MSLYHMIADRWVYPVIEKHIEQGFKQGFEQGFEKGYAQGFNEGRAQAERVWMAWLQRKEAAEAAGEPFYEPPPISRNSNGRSGG